jgi:DNA polymerase-1
MTDEKTLVLIDFNNVLIRGLAANKNLSYNGQLTGGIYGFIGMLTSVINFTLPTNIIVTDDRKPYLRESFYAKYKKDRRKNEDGNSFFEALTYNKDLCIQLLELMNIPIIKERGYEADDWISLLTKKYEKVFDKIICISNDSDLYQILDQNNFYIYKRKGAKTYLYGQQEFKKDYHPLSPKDWIDYTSLVGTHNGFPGIKGIGDVGARKILSNIDLSFKTKRDYKDHFDLAYKVITLPYPNMEFNKLDSDILLKHKSSQSKIDRLLISQGIHVTDKMSEAFSWFR